MVLVNCCDYLFTCYFTLFIIVKQYHDRKYVFHIALPMLALGFDLCVEKLYYKRKAPLVKGETQTQVHSDSMAVAASALNHCHCALATVSMQYFCLLADGYLVIFSCMYE